MKTKLLLVWHTIVLLLSTHFQLSTAFGQGTAFTYQGQLTDSGRPANGRYDFIFLVFDAASGGASLGGSLNANAIDVSNGFFTAALDFGSTPFTGPQRWLQISVSTNGAGSFTSLAPRQQITRAPYATYANIAASVPTGAIANAHLAVDSVGPTNIQNNAVSARQIAAGQVVTSLNGLTDAVSLIQGANVTINTVGNSLQISAPAGGMALPFSGTASSSASIFTLVNSGGGPAGIFLGNVGIGSPFPTARLEIYAPTVGDGVNLSGTSPGYFLSDEANTHRATFAYASANGYFSTDAVAGDTVLRTDTPGGRLLLQNGVFESALTLSDNRVGIGTTSPIAGLHVKKEPIFSNGTLLLEGSTHTYISFYPDGYLAGRKALIGFANPTATQLTIANDHVGAVGGFNGGDIILDTGAPFGAVGINVVDPVYALELPNHFDASVGSARATSWATYSSRRWKDNIRPIPNASTRCCVLRACCLTGKRRKADRRTLASSLRTLRWWSRSW